MFKRILAVTACSILFSMSACSMFQSTAKVVDPVGPMIIDSGYSETTTTTTTVGGVYVEGSYEGTNAMGEDSSMHMEGGVGGITSTSDNGPLHGTATASATGVSASIYDEETGETQTVSVGMPGMGMIGAINTVAAHVPVVTQSTTVSSGPVECGMSLESHGELLKSLYSAAPMQQEELLKSVARSNRITVDQTIAILQTLGYEPQREEAAVAIYPNVCDPNNWFKIYNYVGPVTADEIRARLGL